MTISTIKNIFGSSVLFPSILAAGILLRAAVMVCSGPSPHLSTYISMDEINFLELASNILEFKTFGAWSEGFFTQSTRSPAYPCLLAAASWLSGGWIWAPQALNLFLEALNLVLMYLLGARLSRRGGGVAASAFYAFFGPVFIYAPMAGSEILAVALTLLSSLSLVSLKGSYWRALPAFCVAYALLIHTKPAFLLALPFAIAGVAIELGGAGNVMARLAKSLLPLMIVIALCVPWGLRNYFIHRTFVPVCTVAGWHLVCASTSDRKLAVKELISYVYAPGREGFTEGDYFREGLSISRGAFLEAPAKVFMTGVARLAAAWAPWPPYRVCLPKAYCLPLRFGDLLVIPVPDFEGFGYVVAIALTAAVFLKRRNILAAVCSWLRLSRPVVVLVVGYVAVHVISIPMEQYLFVIEPLLVVLGIGLCMEIYQWGSEQAGHDSEAALMVMCAGVAALSLLLALPLIVGREVSVVEYPKGRSHGQCLGIEDLRRLQWRAFGDIPSGTKASLAGVVKYSTRGWRYIEDDTRGEQCSDSSTAKLYVRLHSPDFPIGIGDARLNFPSQIAPKDGDAVIVRGSVATGRFKDFIVNVESWAPLRENSD